MLSTNPNQKPTLRNHVSLTMYIFDSHKTCCNNRAAPMPASERPDSFTFSYCIKVFIIHGHVKMLPSISPRRGTFAFMLLASSTVPDCMRSPDCTIHPRYPRVPGGLRSIRQCHKPCRLPCPLHPLSPGWPTAPGGLCSSHICTGGFVLQLYVKVW